MTDVFIAFRTLFCKETLRFLKIWRHTICAPILTSILYLVIFNEALGSQVSIDEGISYISFIVPGLVMMTILQSAFSNTASSFIESKISGNLVFILLPAIPGYAVAAAYVCAAFVRSTIAGTGLCLVCLLWTDLPVASAFLLLAFAFSGAVIMASFGLVTALWAEKYDQMGAVMNFAVMPLTILSGVFYSVESLPSPWKNISFFNPFFYLVDGFRQGFFGTGASDASLALVIVSTTALISASAAAVLVARGWRIRK